MALSKRNSRLITVDEVQYRWSFSVDSGFVVIVVQHGEGSGQRLEAQTGEWHWGEPRAVTPAAIAALINYARTHGWKPEEPGRALRLRDIDQAIGLGEAPSR